MGDKTEHLVGLGNNAEIETNERGGSQSKAGYRFDLIDTTAIFGLAEVCKKGAEKYGVDNVFTSILIISPVATSSCAVSTVPVPLFAPEAIDIADDNIDVESVTL